MYGKRYFLCVKCKRVFKWSRYWIEKPEHCGRVMKFLTDREARERIEGVKKGRRMKGVVDSRATKTRWRYG